jgi:hypothetical protein
VIPGGPDSARGGDDPSAGEPELSPQPVGAGRVEVSVHGKVRPERGAGEREYRAADGRGHVIAIESGVAGFFVVVAAASVTGSAWLLVLVLGLAGHGLKDLWQHRTRFVRNTHWWPPFCATVDWVAAGILTGAMLTGVAFHGQGCGSDPRPADYKKYGLMHGAR